MRPIVKVPVQNGVIAAVLAAIFVIGLYYMDRHPFLIPVHFDFRIFLLGIFVFFTLREFRDYYQEGVLHFWQGLIASFIFVNVFGLIAAAFVAAFSLWIPGFLASYISLNLELLKNLPADTIAQIGKPVYERNLSDLPSTNAFDLALLYFWQSLVIGTFISIILSVVLRRQPKT